MGVLCASVRASWSSVRHPALFYSLSNREATYPGTHFTACYPATCPVTTFVFHYSAGDQSLVEHEWKNVSADRGGNHGDIRSTNL